MNVYDFDNTIYDGESVVDFYIFLLNKNPRLMTLMPKMVWMLLRYKACRISEEELLRQAQRYTARFFSYVANRDLVVEFWDKNQKKIKKFYLERRKDDDVVLSASCNILIEEMCQRLGIKTVISSEIDVQNGEILQLCFRERKPEIFRKYFPGAVIDNFYTDSMNDSPMFELARHIYLVKGNKVKELVR